MFQLLSSKSGKYKEKKSLIPLSQKGWMVELCYDAMTLPTVWDDMVLTQNVLLSRNYLQLLQSNPPKEIQFLYLIFYYNNEAIGLAIGQIKHFNAGASLQLDDNSIATRLKSMIAESVTFDTLVCGNLLFTGEHGWYFKPNIPCNAQELYPILMEAYELAASQFDASLPLFFVKDLPEDCLDSFTKIGFNSAINEVNMYLNIPPTWATFDDYIAAMNTKYRTRYKRALKAKDGVEVMELSADRIALWQHEINQLYTKIAEASIFNLVSLAPTYFEAFKRAFPDIFRLFGYFQHGKMIAFCSTIHNGLELEAHFLGYEKSVNASKQLYLNMLYDMVRVGIESASHSVQFARTAPQIKSSVGAVPEQRLTLLRHQNKMINCVIPSLANYLSPVEPWQQCHPFKG